MKVLRKSVFLFLASLALVLASGALMADPCLVVYPDGACVYHYDPAEYYAVGPGEPYYDPMYDRGGEVLLELASNEIDMSIYQAPGLAGFEMSTGGNDGYFFHENTFTLLVDGFSNAPTTYVNILLVFDKTVPTGCTPVVLVNGVMVTGSTYGIGDLVVSTPTPDGNNYSDTRAFDIEWYGCSGMHVWAFADADYDGKKDGGECFTAFSHDLTVPTEDTTWGGIKSLYR